MILPAVLVRLPASPEKTTGELLVKLEWFGRLKISARNCSRLFESRRNSLCRETSILNTLGEMRVLRPTFPSVPASGTENERGELQRIVGGLSVGAHKIDRFK